MDTADLLRDLEGRKILIAAEGSRLHWRGPASAMTPCVLAELRARRKELVALLRVEAALSSRQWDGAHPVLGGWRAGVAAAASAANPGSQRMIVAANCFLDGPHAVAAAHVRWSTLEVWGVARGGAEVGLVPHLVSHPSSVLVTIDRNAAIVLGGNGTVYEKQRVLSGGDIKPFWQVAPFCPAPD